MAVSSEYLKEKTGLIWSTERTTRNRGLVSFIARMFERLRRGWPARARAVIPATEAPVVERSMVYGLCRHYEAATLWQRYYAFRMDPTARTWQKLRRVPVPWQRGLRLEALLAEFPGTHKRRTPDADVVNHALTTISMTSKPATFRQGRQAPRGR